MSDSIKETALAMALTATRDLPASGGETAVNVAKKFEAYLAEAPPNQVRIERDEARARVAALEQELGEIASLGTIGYAAKRALRLVLELSERYEEGDKLVIGAAVESAAARLEVTL